MTTNLTTKTCTATTNCTATTCALCNTANDCAVCKDPKSWVQIDSQGSCVATAPATYKIIPWGRYEAYSSSCLSGYSLSGSYCIMPCTSSTCATCGSSGTLCTSCTGTNIISPTGRSVEGTCTLSTCSTGLVLTADGNRCSTCDSSCTTCTEGYSLSQCSTCSNSTLLQSTAPSYCVSSCPSGSHASGVVCVPNQSSSSSSNDNTGWYVGAIVIGCIAMLAFFAFVIYILIAWKLEDTTSSSASNPSGALPASGAGVGAGAGVGVGAGVGAGAGAAGISNSSAPAGRSNQPLPSPLIAENPRPDAQPAAPSGVQAVSQPVAQPSAQRPPRHLPPIDNPKPGDGVGPGDSQAMRGDPSRPARQLQTVEPSSGVVRAARSPGPSGAQGPSA